MRGWQNVAGVVVGSLVLVEGLFMWVVRGGPLYLAVWVVGAAMVLMFLWVGRSQRALELRTGMTAADLRRMSRMTPDELESAFRNGDWPARRS